MIENYSFPLIAIFLGILVIIAETLNRWGKIDAELARKIVHIGSGNVILIAWWLDIPTTLIIQASLGASLVAIASYFLPILPSINGVGRKSFGTLFYAMSIGILTAWFWIYLKQPVYTVIGILVMSWGDGMAGIIGKRFGKHPYQIFGNQKSWEGSLTMLLVSLIVISLILGFNSENLTQNLITSVIVAIAATLLESFSKLGIDNLTVPLGSASLCFYLQQILF